MCMFAENLTQPNPEKKKSAKLIAARLVRTRNPETQGGCPWKFDPWTQPDPENQNPNQPQHQPILNFT